MKLAIMQPYFMPYLGYFQIISAVDKYILYDQVAYIVKGYVNRNRIRPRNCPPLDIIVPIKNKSSFELIANTQIDYSQSWNTKLLKTIRNAYSRAPYFMEVMPMLESILLPQYDSIGALNIASIHAICQYVGITTMVEESPAYSCTMEAQLVRVIEGDYSFYPELAKTQPERKVARVLEMCKHEGANTYINPIGGMELYKKDEFKQYGINLQFHKMNNIFYNQKSDDGSFEPYMSIIDVLMHNGKEGTKKLLNEYTLI